MPSLTRKDPAAVKLGRRGGKAGRGAAKARDPETMRRASLKRWAIARAKAGLSLHVKPRQDPARKPVPVIPVSRH